MAIVLVGMTKEISALVLVEAEATSSFFFAFSVRSSNHKKQRHLSTFPRRPAKVLERKGLSDEDGH